MAWFPEIQITAGCYIGLALGILLLPLDWLLAAILAAVVHELCHMLAIWFCGGRVEYLRLGIGGAQIGMTILSPWQEALCALAGPLGGILLVLFGRLLPRFAVCAFLQSTYNLLPLYPLDGGRALRCLAATLLEPSKTIIVVKTIEWLCVLGLMCTTAYISILLPLNGWLAAGVLLLLLRKIPCKRREERVQ